MGNNARALVFAGALPLLAAFSGGCKTECYSYNDTTITLNRPADGRTARMAELERIPASPLIDEPAIDLLNETHAISSAPMPPDAKATLIPKECVAKGKNAYACSGGSYEDRGTYFDGPVFVRPFGSDVVAAAGLKPDSWAELAHELGHLLDGEGTEVLPQLNEYEQALMAHVVFSRQGFQQDSMRWGYIYPGLDFQAYRIPPSKRGTFNMYDRADILVAMKLLEHNGDFGAVRAGLMDAQSRGTLSREEQNAVDEYLFGYSGSTVAEETNNLADMSVRLKIATAGYLARAYGLSEALDYFAALSRRISGDGIGYSLGLDGMACSIMDTPKMVTGGWGSPSTDCTMHGTPEFTAYMDRLRLCCASAESSGGAIVFRKHVITVADQVCFGDMRGDGFTYEALDVFRILQKQEIGIGESCE
ncbi:MAG: hypothetical protein NTY83_04300 [Candidatus Micrarchaeota archaeon]|nr:hypothetical protein [Candidatus Micrarchaeota archaeon]